MNQQTMEGYLILYKDILKQVKEEVNKLTIKQEELNQNEENILTIKHNTSEILKILQESHAQSKNNSTNIEQTIKSLTKTINIHHNSYVLSLIKINESAIATGDHEGRIRLISIVYDYKQWTMDFQIAAHTSGIKCLLKCNDNILISGSNDGIIKVWRINNKNELSLPATLEGHKDQISQIIPITNSVIASSSQDWSIIIWNVHSYQLIHKIKENFIVFSLLKLKNKDLLVSAGSGNEISFWNTLTFNKENSVKCCSVWSRHGLIELPNQFIAVNGGLSDSIDIIDTDNYNVYKKIKCEDFIVSSSNSVYFSALNLLTNGTWIYAHEMKFCQVSFKEWDVVFKKEMKDEFSGNAIINMCDGKYIIATNCIKGVSVFKVEFK